MAISGKTARQHVKCLYSGILLSNEKEQTTDRCSDWMNLKHDDDWKSSYMGVYSVWFHLSEVLEESN